ncbi:aminopeptidase [Eubacteriales bacterium OttesenSCG-928-N14]|nr:aminopeptidase [Eubacteriales bacterium OttesenSCG-928-N14]
MDNRIEKLADVLINYSCELKLGEKVWINSTLADTAFIEALVAEVYAQGALPFVTLNDPQVTRSLMLGMDDELAKLMAKYDAPKMDGMDAYIGIFGAANSFETSDVPPQANMSYRVHYGKPVHSERRVPNTKWVVLRYPSPAMAQMAGMSTHAFEDFYFSVCNLDYGKMSVAMDSLVDLMNRTDKVRLVGPGTDLAFSIKDIPAIKCDGKRNIPDGEVYTAPVRDSINGEITFNAPSLVEGFKYENVRFVFKNGKIVEATGNDTERINRYLDTDECARYVGEFAIGVNPNINQPMCDTLFDEKINGSIHLTPGNCYDNAENGNKSAIHWDLVMIQTKEFGGGEMYFDDVLVRKDGRFTVEELDALQPENLR